MSLTATQFTIDPEFRALIPALSADERAQLEANLRAEGGCRDPLVVWLSPEPSGHKCYADDVGVEADCRLIPGDGVWTCETCGYNPAPYEYLLVDGHNRYDICTAHGLKFDTVEIDLESRDDVKIWIIRNQFGRRNLQPYQRGELALVLKPLIAAEAKSRQGRRSDLLENSPKGQPINTRVELARASGLSDNTIAKVEVIARKAPEPVKVQLRAGEISIDRAYQDIRGRERRVERVDRILEIASHNVPLDDAVIQPASILYADPPWQYEHVKTDNRAIENQYPTMTLEAICALPVSTIATADAVLFLWATSPKLAEAMRVVDAWGFTYRTCMVWVKDQIGMGYYARQQHELLLIATRGELPVPEPEHRPASVVESPRREHSAKPAVFYQLIEQMYPEYAKRELFGRAAAREGWLEPWGNQSA